MLESKEVPQLMLNDREQIDATPRLTTQRPAETGRIHIQRNGVEGRPTQIHIRQVRDLHLQIAQTPQGVGLNACCAPFCERFGDERIDLLGGQQLRTRAAGDR